MAPTVKAFAIFSPLSTNPSERDDLSEEKKTRERSDDDVGSESGDGHRKRSVGGGQSVELEAPLQGVATNHHQREKKAKDDRKIGGGERQ